jgi:Cytochrome C biogenesis protein
MKRLGEILLLSVAVAMLMGADTQNARFERLGHKVMCTCGDCTYLLLECNHVGCPNSTRMIRQLHALTGTAGGASTDVSGMPPQSDDEAVLNWFRQTWGVTAVVEPATHGLELWAWILPPAALGLGLLAAVVVIRQWRRRAPKLAPAGPELDPQLEPLRARARRETQI